MALAKSSSAITQFTAAGTSSAIDTSGGVGVTVSLHHSNGTGSVTAAGTAQINYKVNGAARTYSPAAYLVTFTTTTAGTVDRVVTLPDSVTSVSITYTAPTGPTGYTLDAEISWVTP